MPARISRSSTGAAAPKQAKKKNKSTKRSLNAFAIAEAEAPESHHIRRTRLGQVEDDEPRFKRRRADSEEGEGDDEDSAPRKRHHGGDDDDEATNSDGEGNIWKMGVVDEDDDSDIDSEEAFGSSDEERFEGWTFRGGDTHGKAKSKPRRIFAGKEETEVDLAEDEVEESDEESLGSEAVDLATMLDNYEESDDEEATDEDDNDSDRAPPSDYSVSDVDDDDLDKTEKLQNLVSSLHPQEKTTKKAREIDAHESKAPSAAGVVSSQKFDINDFLASTSDAQVTKVSKEIGSLPKAPKKDHKLAPSLPKRQRDRLDRIVANEKTKESLERWVDTVKHQRRAEHLSFPLVDPDSAVPSGSKQLLPASQSKPFNDLESTIANIMVESGLTSGRHDEEEERLRAFEELKTNKMPIEEVIARRAELRKARDLLFREEVRAKRIKKIKSKAFRRIKRKEREKLSQMDRDAFKEGWEGEMDEEEREEADRKRAEERMSLKHKDSKWSKQMKKSGRSAWDDEAMAGMTEMARKREELQRRIEGKEVRGSDDDGDENVSSSDDDEGDENDDGADFSSLRRQIDRAEGHGENDHKTSGLHGLKFMREAEERRKKENQEAIEQMRRELAGEDSGSDGDDDATIGRKIFAPAQPSQAHKPTPVARGEFEELDGSDGEDAEYVLDAGSHSPSRPSNALPNAKNSASKLDSSQQTKSDRKSNSTTSIASINANSNRVGKNQKPTIPEPTTELLPNEKHSQPDADGWVTVSYGQEVESEDEAEPTGGVLSQTEILRRAFAADDVEDEFEAEKNAEISDEDEKMIDETLPGWGSWVGSGLSKREKAKNKNKKLVKKEGIKREDRKDRNLKGVVISEKRIKKNADYLAKELPLGYATKREYEGSIRMPLGGEWNTGTVVRDNVKPRVIVKKGAIIKPMSKSLL